MPALSPPIGPAWTYTDVSIDQDPLIQSEVVPSTEVSEYSDGVAVTSFDGGSYLYVDSVTGFDTTGALILKTSTGTALVYYTDTASSGTPLGGPAFEGCQYISGTGTLSAGSPVTTWADGGQPPQTYYTQPAQCCVQMADGRSVVLFAAGGNYYLLQSIMGKTGVQLVASAPYGAEGQDAAFCLATDSNGNVYVCQGVNGADMYLWQWAPGTDGWTLSGSGTLSGAAALYTPYSMVWVSDGSSGHLVISTEESLLSVAVGSLSAIVNSITGLDDCPRVLCCEGFGTANGLVVSTHSDGTWTLSAATWSSSSGTLSMGTVLQVATQTLPAAWACAPQVLYTDNLVYVVLFIDELNNIYACALSTSVASSEGVIAPNLIGFAHQARHGLPSDFASYADPDNSGRAWVVNRSSSDPTTIVRLGLTTTTSPAVTWDTVTFPVAVGMDASSTSVMCPPNPQIAQVDVVLGCVPATAAAFCLTGTYTVPPYTPSAPTLQQPLFGSAQLHSSSVPFQAATDLLEEQVDAALALAAWPAQGSVQWWTGSGFTSLEYWITGVDVEPAGELNLVVDETLQGAPGAGWAWTAYTRDANGIVSQIPYWSYFVSADAPSVSVDVVSDATSLPTVQVTAFTPGTTGAPMATWQVLVYPHGAGPTSTTPLYNSGVQAYGGDLPLAWPIPAPNFLTEGTDYDIYVVVTDTCGATNAFNDFITMSPTYTAPATPVMTATAQDDGELVALVLSGGTNGNLALFQYSTDGTNWYYVRGGDPTSTDTISGSDYALNDYEYGAQQGGAGAGATVHYRCQQWDTTNNQLSAWSEAVTVTIPSWTGYFWLKDPTNAALNAQVQVKPPWAKPIDDVSSSYTVLGASLDVVVSDGLRGPSGPVTFIVADTTGLAELLALIGTTSATYLIQAPNGDSFYIWLTGPREFSWEFSPVDLPYFEVPCKYTSVAAP